MPKWLSSGWTRSPTSETSPPPSMQGQERHGEETVDSTLPQPATSPGLTPTTPQPPGAMSFLQRLSGAAKRASLSLTHYGDSSSNADKASNKSPLHTPNLADEDDRSQFSPENRNEERTSMLSALGFGRSATSPKPQKTASSASRPAWQTLGAGFGYDVHLSNEHLPSIPAHNGIRNWPQPVPENQEEEMEDEIDLRTNPSEDGDTSSMGDAERDGVAEQTHQQVLSAQEDRPVLSKPPSRNATNMTPSNSGLSSAASVHVPGSMSSITPRAPGSYQPLNAAAPSFTPGSRAPSASFTFVAPSSAPKMSTAPAPASPVPTAKSSALEQGQGREKRFRAVNDPDGMPVSHPTGASAETQRPVRPGRQDSVRASSSIPPSLFAPPPPSVKKLEIRPPSPKAPLPPEDNVQPLPEGQDQRDVASTNQGRDSSMGEAVSAVASTARAGLARLLNPVRQGEPDEWSVRASPTPDARADATADAHVNAAVTDDEEEGEGSAPHNHLHHSQTPSHTSDRAAVAAKLNQAVRTATQRHAAHLSANSIGSQCTIPLTPQRAVPSKLGTASGAKNASAARSEMTEAEDIVEQIVARVDTSLELWAQRILQRVQMERAASSTAVLTRGETPLLPSQTADAFVTPARGTSRSQTLPPGAPRLSHGSPRSLRASKQSPTPSRRRSHGSALLSPPADADEELPSTDPPEVLSKVEQGVRDKFSNYIKRLPLLGSSQEFGVKSSDGSYADQESTADHADVSKAAAVATGAEDHSHNLHQASPALDFDYVEETLQAKVRELEVQVLNIVTEGFKTAALSSSSGTDRDVVMLSLSSEEIGHIADSLDTRVREALTTAQVELLRAMAQPSPAIMGVLSDTEAAINAHAASFTATQQTVEELLQTLPDKFDSASEALAGAGRGVAEQVQNSVVDALQPQLDGLRANWEKVDGEVLAARVLTSLVPLLEGRHDELPERIAETVAGHLRADLRSQVQLQMQAHLQAQIQDADAAREAALRRLVMPAPSTAFAPSPAVSLALSSPPLRRERESDSFEVASTGAATTAVDISGSVAPTPGGAMQGKDVSENEDEKERKAHKPTDDPNADPGQASRASTGLTAESLSELSKLLAEELHASGGTSLDPVVERLDPLVNLQEKTWNLGNDLLAQQGELAGTLRALPAALAAKTDVFLTATHETQQTQQTILERLMHVADANHAAQAHISELEEAAAKRSEALDQAHKAQAQLTGELREARAELSTLNTDVSTLKEEVDDLESRLEKAQTNATTATEQLRDAHSRLRDAVEARHAAERAGDEIRRRIIETEAELQRAHSASSLANARAEDADAALKRERGERTFERTSMHSEAADLRARLERASKETQEAYSRLDSYVQEAQKVRSQAGEDVIQAEARAAKAEGALGVSQARVKELDNRVQGLVQDSATHNQMAVSAQQRLTEAEKRAEALSEAQLEVERLQTALRDASEKIAASQTLESELTTSRATEKVRDFEHPWHQGTFSFSFYFSIEFLGILTLCSLCRACAKRRINYVKRIID